MEKISNMTAGVNVLSFTAQPTVQLAGFGWTQATGLAALIAAMGALWAVRLYFLTGARIKVHAELDKNDRLRITVGNLGRLKTEIVSVGVGTLCRRRPTLRWPFFQRRHELLNLNPSIKIEGFTAGTLQPGDPLNFLTSWPSGEVRGIREAIRNGKPSNWYSFAVDGFTDRRIRVAVVYYDGIKAARIRRIRHSKVTFPSSSTPPPSEQPSSPPAAPPNRLQRATARFAEKFCHARHK